jgi:hypothetical protein
MNIIHKLKTFWSKNKKIILVTILMFFIFSISYIFFIEKIIYLKFVLKTYKPSENTEQVEIPSIFNNPKIKIPTTVYKITSPRIIKTYRDDENVYNIVKKASNILNQADIEIEIKEIKELKIDLEIFKEDCYFEEELFEYINNLPEADNDNMKIIFLKRGLNYSYLQIGGFSKEEYRMAYIIDKYSADDFEILAHEIGHLLGLSHHSEDEYGSTEYLMDKGGPYLTEEEAIVSYENAILYFNQ